ncbi:hypothetical protein JZ751_027574 [Albula glossodonta]|uniref:Uncharacterized protein n=1 Tax=Albula glossodonta TaxID=121402 RepID=A0A8T2MX46_9TELE|nr:hypothetical protein JZ751_027574 [Albula glossodonta]
MTEENDLERRAVEELLSEAARAKVRAETMGPAGWVKCPLRSTNKRFLLNTLRPTLQRRPGSSATGQSEARDRRQWVEPRSGTQKGVQSRDRSRSPNTSLQRDSNPTTARRPHTDQPIQPRCPVLGTGQTPYSGNRQLSSAQC